MLSKRFKKDTKTFLKKKKIKGASMLVNNIEFFFFFFFYLKKKKKRQYGSKRYVNPLEDGKQRLVEYIKNLECKNKE